MAPRMHGGRFIQQDQAGGGGYNGPDNPNSPIAALKRGSSATGEPYRGLQDFPGLQAQSNATYDAADRNIRAGGMGFNTTIDLMNNQQAKVSPWAPFFQALDNQHATNVRQDAARPRGIADDPTSTFNPTGGPFGKFGAGTGENFQPAPFPESTNIATPGRLTPRNGPMPEGQDSFEARLYGNPALAGLKRYGR